jgi:hypothetical protein
MTLAGEQKLLGILERMEKHLELIAAAQARKTMQAEPGDHQKPRIYIGRGKEPTDDIKGHRRPRQASRGQ